VAAYSTDPAIVGEPTMLPADAPVCQRVVPVTASNAQISAAGRLMPILAPESSEQS
jgi:hypothetical protein